MLLSIVREEGYMTAEERIRRLRTIEKIERNKNFSEKIGIKDVSNVRRTSEKMKTCSL